MLTLARDALRAYLPLDRRGTDDPEKKEPALPEVVPSELSADQQQQTRKTIAVLNHKLGTNFLVPPLVQLAQLARAPTAHAP